MGVALKNAGIKLPPMHITVNLAPADLRKEGNAYENGENLPQPPQQPALILPVRSSR